MISVDLLIFSFICARLQGAEVWHCRIGSFVCTLRAGNALCGLTTTKRRHGCTLHEMWICLYYRIYLAGF